MNIAYSIIMLAPQFLNDRELRISKVKHVSWFSIVSIVTRLWAGPSGFRIPAEAKDISLL
jgi:hypothetical protein